jgi:outer membrane biosynthesis protein TonB
LAKGITSHELASIKIILQTSKKIEPLSILTVQSYCFILTEVNWHINLTRSLMNDSFEAQKNKKAFSYTVLICVAVLLIAILYTWPMQFTPTPVAQDLIEINLGNEQEGLGDVQPLVKGDPAPETKEIYSHTKYSPAKEEPAKDIEADEKDDAEAAPITKPAKIKNEAKNIAKETVLKPVKNPNPAPVVNATPIPPKPKLPLYKGGTGNGGNGAAEDNGFRNQGYKPGNGDAGSPDGKPDSYGNSPGGRSGVSVVRGLSGRRPIHFPSMQDDFNENAKIYVDIKVNASGAVTDASIARGTTTANASLRSIALQKAKQLKFPVSKNDEEAGTILFNFILKS